MVRLRVLLGLSLLAVAPACVAEASAPTTDPVDLSTAHDSAHVEAADAGDAGTGTDAHADASSRGLALSVHTTLGIPEPAAVDDPAHALLVKDEYVTSYDSERKTPRWTSWELTKEWLGTAERSSGFRRDTELPTSFPQATSNDFDKSGYQQGHLCPSADRTKSDVVNEATFVFTNVVPQSSASNLGTWKTLENEERAQVTAGNHVFVVAGPLFEAETMQTIGASVAVPTSMFKVVVVLRGEHPQPTDVKTSTRVIAVDIPNTAIVRGNYRDFRTSVADLEKRTGFHLLSDVPPAVHDAIATSIDAL